MIIIKCGNARRGMMKSCFDCHLNAEYAVLLGKALIDNPNCDEELRGICACNPPYIVKVVRKNICLLFQP